MRVSSNNFSFYAGQCLISRNKSRPSLQNHSHQTASDFWTLRSLSLCRNLNFVVWIEYSATWIAKPSDLPVHYPIIGTEVHIPKCYPNGENKTSTLWSLQITANTWAAPRSKIFPEKTPLTRCSIRAPISVIASAWAITPSSKAKAFVYSSSCYILKHNFVNIQIHLSIWFEIIT